jgi:ribonuclease D
MKTSNMTPPRWIDHKDSFSAMLRDLQECQILAVDTESNSLFAYQEQVCLIQFSTETVDYLLDPLALRDLSPLGEIFNNPQIEKVFHAAEYDLICLKRDYGFSFSNLFDTMLACRILGRENLGLASILREEYEFEVNKRFQRADWGMRPLKPEMLEYARLDTHFLIDLRHRLKADLIAKERWPLALEDFERLCSVSAQATADDQDKCWKVLGNNKLTSQQLAVLQALCEYREQRAKFANLPVFKVLNDATLLAIAKALPEDLQAMLAVPELSPKIIQRHGAHLVKVVKNGMLQKPYRQAVRHKRPDNGYMLRVEALRNWRKKTAAHIGVASDVVLPRDVLYAIVNAGPDDLKGLEAVLADLPWRYAHFGSQILAALQNADQPDKETVLKLEDENDENSL